VLFGQKYHSHFGDINLFIHQLTSIGFYICAIWPKNTTHFGDINLFIHQLTSIGFYICAIWPKIPL